MDTKYFKFIYKQAHGETCGLFPIETVIKTEHHFNEDSRWVPVLHQFCKFLESTGYVGVNDRIIIKDPYGMESDGILFETTGSRFDEDDFDEEDEDDEEEEDKDFQDIKKEIE
jgi:hypothetical protein